MSRVFNFSAGPAMVPQAVLEKAQSEMLDWNGTGMSTMEMSHRGKDYMSIAEKAMQTCVKLWLYQILTKFYSCKAVQAASLQ